MSYQSYLASREWAVRREAVRARAGNRCERVLDDMRCSNQHESTHHKTYANVGHEPLEDLLAMCNACHEWLSGKSSIDPLQRNFCEYETITNRDGNVAFRVCGAPKHGTVQEPHLHDPGYDDPVVVCAWHYY